LLTVGALGPLVRLVIGSLVGGFLALMAGLALRR